MSEEAAATLGSCMLSYFSTFILPSTTCLILPNPLFGKIVAVTYLRCRPAPVQAAFCRPNALSRHDSHVPSRPISETWRRVVLELPIWSPAVWALRGLPKHVLVGRPPWLNWSCINWCSDINWSDNNWCSDINWSIPCDSIRIAAPPL